MDSSYRPIDGGEGTETTYKINYEDANEHFEFYIKVDQLPGLNSLHCSLKSLEAFSFSDAHPFHFFLPSTGAAQDIKGQQNQ